MKVSLLFLMLWMTLINLGTAPSRQESSIIEVRFGTSFGQCSGYCIQEISFRNGIAEKTLTPHRAKSLKSTKCSMTYSNFSELTSRINIGVFNELEATIGCPDCSDGGAEWVQIITSDGTRKKVTYDFGKEPPALQLYIKELRQYFDQIGECD